MVSGKVKKVVMGFQKSPATPKPEPPRRSSSSLKSPVQISSGKASSVFSRSFGVYFPRSSAQVLPRPPDISDLLRLVQDLQEKESRLRAEHKILNETLAVVPFMEMEIRAKNDELDRVQKVADGLDSQNRVLRAEAEALLAKIREIEDDRRKRDAEIEGLKRTLSDQQSQLSVRSCARCSAAMDDCSSKFQGLIDASARSVLLKNIRRSSAPAGIALNPGDSKHGAKDRNGKSSEPPRLARIPRPPPLPSALSQSSSCCKNQAGLPAIPPPPPPPPSTAAVKGARSETAFVRRVPEVVEFYHSMMRRDIKRDSAGGVGDTLSAANARSMIGEIENRSAHLLAIKTDVETQGDFIRCLIKQVQNAAFSNIEDLVAFVKWLDNELSFLVDERAVLKHFEWPEAKSDAMREAAFGYRDLRKLEAEASSFCDDPRQPCASAIKKMQSLLEKLEHGIYSLSRVREGAIERYKNFQIPWDWMLDSAIASLIKHASVKLAMKYMKRVTSEISAATGGGPEEEELLLQGVRFAFRVHQFAGGFDVETMRAFQELKDKARKRQADKQNQQQQQKLFSRSAPNTLTPC